MTQLQMVVEYFIINNNESFHYKKVANDLGILIPNMRRILGQGELIGLFTRVSKGIYTFNDNAIYNLVDVISNNDANEFLNLWDEFLNSNRSSLEQYK